MKLLSFMLITAILGWGSKIKVMESTSQEWVGGLQESGYGTNYKLNITVKAGSDKLQINDLWVGDIHMKTRVINPVNPSARDFKKGTTITVRAEVTFRPGADAKIRQLNAGDVRKPFNFKGQGLLGYTYKGKAYYLEIPDIKELEKIIYP